MDRANALGMRARTRLEQFSRMKDLTPIGNIRGLGSMLGFDVVTARGSHEIVIDGAKKITARAHAQGLILLGCGAQSEAIRLLFPLTASEAIVDEGMLLLEAALRAE